MILPGDKESFLIYPDGSAVGLNRKARDETFRVFADCA
jgi:hypothetical protein